MHFGVEMHDGRSVSSRVTPWGRWRKVNLPILVRRRLLRRHSPPGSRVPVEDPSRGLLGPEQNRFPRGRGIGRCKLRQPGYP
jgi:hypothetical protein